LPELPREARRVDVAVVGGGQSGLATGYHLRRLGLLPGRDVLLLDAAAVPGGAWARMWDDLHLFSPAAYSSLPGWLMPPDPHAGRQGAPSRAHVVDYLTAYEQRYELAVERPAHVRVVPSGDRLLVEGSGVPVAARVVVSATGTWDQPYWPAYPGAREFHGTQRHAAAYRSPGEYAGRRVVVVGGGNSAAQVLAEVSTVAASTTWVAPRPPRFLPDDVDGRVLFETASARVRARREGREHDGVGGLGDIVVVPSVREARDRGVMVARPMFSRLTASGVAWADGTSLDCDAVLWCTGFRPALRHLAGLGLREHDGTVAVGGPAGTRSLREPRLHLVGYGDWTGPASATLIGVGRTARATARQVAEQLGRATVSAG
jgi:putative flavoprotein involved in K+ transport